MEATAVHQHRALQIHPADNVGVVLDEVAPGETVWLGDEGFEISDEVPRAHKIALREIAPGEPIIKYGFPIGHATEAIGRGRWIHSHNMATGLSDTISYEYAPAPARAVEVPVRSTFRGYRRQNGRVGTRNELWVLNTVGCVNRSAERIARLASERYAGVIDGAHAFAHPFGCSQLGDDLQNTRRVLAGLMRHPNAGGVLVIGLGCENNQMEGLLELAGDIDRSRLRFFNSQEVFHEIEAGMEAVEELVEIMRHDERTECPASDLVIGLKCGGSDAFSGISANPLVGRIADRVTAEGGAAVLSEVPEMFGAEHILMNRAADEDVFKRIVEMINTFKGYFIEHNQPIYENPSPGNKAGGLTTLEEKSLGATQKGGTATVVAVLGYCDSVARPGLSLLTAPGNDGVSVTAEVASGATVVLFTTGRGTPLGFPAPTIKISTNTEIYEKKPHWIDFNAGKLLDGTATAEELAEGLWQHVLRVASGEVRTCNEQNDFREIAIWKNGVTL
jgi:altronate hydrolase